MTPQTFHDFDEFYPYYLAEHRDARNRRCHVAGVAVAAVLLAAAAVTRRPTLAVAAIAGGYGLSWLGHFAFERNKPAAFGHPLYSLRGDLTMAADVARGRVKL